MKIALIGDSHSQAVFPRLVPLLEAEGHEVVWQVSKPGWGARSLLSAGSAAPPAETEAVMVSLGGNNHDLSDSYGETVDAFLDGMQGLRVAWVGPAASDASIAPSTAARHEWTARFLGPHLRKRGIAFIDARRFTREGHRNDGVHFTSAAYDRWADSVLRPFLRSIRFLPPARRGIRVFAWGAGGAALIWGLYWWYRGR